MQTTRLTREYPRLLSVRSGDPISVRRITKDDCDRVADFARRLGEEDLLFLRVDLTNPKVVAQIAAEQSDDSRVTLLAETGDELVGYAGLNRRPLDWMRHLAELRVIVGTEQRSTGLGSRLARELFLVANDLGMTKLVAQMVREQEGARRMFENLGFSPEALLPDWVIDREGRTRDLVIMAHDVTALTN